MLGPIAEEAASMMAEAGLTYTSNETAFLEKSYQLNKDRFFVVASTLYSSKLMERSLAEHAEALVKSAEAAEKYTVALVKSAEASERHAASLMRATWVLAAATVLLFMATAALVYVTTIVSH